MLRRYCEAEAEIPEKRIPGEIRRPCRYRHRINGASIEVAARIESEDVADVRDRAGHGGR